MKVTEKIGRRLVEDGFENLKVGTQVHYTGDVANQSGNGTIVNVRPPSKWVGTVSYDIELEDGRTMNGVMPTNFGSGRGGHRFELGHKVGNW